MTTPNRRGGGPGQSPGDGFFDEFPTPWNSQWVLKPPVDDPNTVDLTAGPGGGAMGTAGMGGTGGARPDGVDGVKSINTDRISALNNRNQNIVSALLGDAIPMLNSWEYLADALFNGLLAGFTGIEHFLETLWKVLTGQEIDLSFLSDTVREIFEALQTAFGPIGEFLDWLWTNVGQEIFQAIMGVLAWVYDEFSQLTGTTPEDALKDIFGFLAWLFSQFGTTIESVLKPIFEFLKWLFVEYGPVVNSFLKPLIQFLKTIWDGVGQATLTAIFSTLKGVWDTLGQTAINNIVDLFRNLTVLPSQNLLGILQDVVYFFKQITLTFGSIGNALVLSTNFNGLVTQVENNLRDVTGWITGLINGLTGGFFESVQQAISMVVGWVAQIPLIGPIISAIVPDEWENSAGRPAASLSDLKSFSAELVKTNSAIPASNLSGFVPPDLLPVVGPGFVGAGAPNLLTDPSFKSAAAVQEGAGWSWDSTTSRTSGDGGAAKVVGDGGVKQLFSNLVAVSPGQKLEVSVWVKWTKPTPARPTISLGIRGYDGESIKFTSPIDPRANIVTDSDGVPGNSSGWVKLSGTYQIPESTQEQPFTLTHVRMVLGVANAPYGTSVWFDEGVLKKVSLIGQKLIDGSTDGSNLADDIENTIGSDQWQDLLNRVAKKNNATPADVQATIEDFLDGDSIINGDKVKVGNISADVIAELQQTWSGLAKGSSGRDPGGAVALVSAINEIDKQRVAVVGISSVANQAILNSGSNKASIDDLNAKFIALRSYVVDLKYDVDGAVIRTGGTPRSASTPPGGAPRAYSEASDNFDRTSLGSGWSIARRRNGGNVILNGRTATFASSVVPGVTLVPDNVSLALVGSTSASPYQRIFSSYASTPGSPLAGTPGFNDLVGRANGPTVGVVARFYGNKNVKIFYRNGGMESDAYNPPNVFGTFTLPSAVTAGSMMEFYVGIKGRGEPAACYLKQGGWISQVVYMPASIVWAMGYGWGFGMGFGSSVAALMEPAQVDYWGAQDQS